MNLKFGLLAWLIIALYEYRCPKGQMLCEVLDPVITKHPVLTRLVILYTAMHMANLLPTRGDLYCRLAVTMGR